MTLILKIDSVVLSLSYQGAYGDTGERWYTNIEGLRDRPEFRFNDTTLYSYSDPASDFATVGPELGSATFAIKDLKDTQTLIRAGDTTYVTECCKDPVR